MRQEGDSPHNMDARRQGRPRVLVTIPWTIGLLERHAEVTYGRIGDDPQADGVVVGPTDSLGAEDLDSLPRLRAVAVAGSGTDAVDATELARRHVSLVSAPAPTALPTAELTLCLILMLARGIGPAMRDLEADRWSGWSFDHVVGRDLAGLTLGLVGFGRIGRVVGRLASCFDMRILHHCRTPTGVDGYVADLDELLCRSDIVSVHLPLDGRTRGMIGMRELQLMPSGSALVNTSRGGIVDENALAEVLRSHHLSGAGLDVFASEPERPAELLQLPNVIVTPHIGTATRDARTSMADTAAEQLLAALRIPVPGA